MRADPITGEKVAAEEQFTDLTRAVELGPDCFVYPLSRGIFHAGRGDRDLLEAKRLDPERAAEADGIIARFRLERLSSGKAK